MTSWCQLSTFLVSLTLSPMHCLAICCRYSGARPRMQQPSQISQSCQLSVDRLRATASSTGNSTILPPDVFYRRDPLLPVLPSACLQPIAGRRLYFVLFCCRVVQDSSASICPCLHVGNPQPSCGTWLCLAVGPNNSPR